MIDLGTVRDNSGGNPGRQLVGNVLLVVSYRISNLYRSLFTHAVHLEAHRSLAVVVGKPFHILKSLGDAGDIAEFDTGTLGSAYDGYVRKLSGPVPAFHGPQQDFAGFCLELTAGKLDGGISDDRGHLIDGKAIGSQGILRYLDTDL